MQLSCLFFKHTNTNNKSYRFGSNIKNYIIVNINNIYIDENIRLGNNKNKRNKCK